MLPLPRSRPPQPPTPAPAPRRAAVFDPKEATLLGQLVEAGLFDVRCGPDQPDPAGAAGLSRGLPCRTPQFRCKTSCCSARVRSSTDSSRRARRIPTNSCSPFAAPPVGPNGGTTPSAGIRVPFRGSPIRAGSAPALRAFYDTIEVVGISRQCIGRVPASARSLKSAGGLRGRSPRWLRVTLPPLVRRPSRRPRRSRSRVTASAPRSPPSTSWKTRRPSSWQKCSARLHFRFAARGRRIVRRGVQRTRAHFVAGRQRAGSGSCRTCPRTGSGSRTWIRSTRLPRRGR